MTSRASVLACLLLAACSSRSADSVEPAELRQRDAAAGGDAAAEPDAGSDATRPDTFVDPRDGQSYRTVTIGNQTWLARNLAWAGGSGSYCYDDDETLCEKYGRLYTWSAARTACPAGWHLGSDDDWKALEAALGMAADDLDLEGYSTPRGTDEGTQLKDATGFGAKMAGYRGGSSYDALEDRTYFWTSTTRGSEVWRRRVAAAEPTVFRFTNPPSGFAISVRCVRE